MRIGLIGDTHIPEVCEELPSEIKEIFRGVDIILHTGDVYTVAVLDELQCLAPVLASCGDDDGADVYCDRRMDDRHFLKMEGMFIGLMHYGPWLGSEKKNSQDQMTIYRTTANYTWYPDIVVCGHTHKCRVEKRNGVLIVNPGSATFPRYIAEKGTVGLLTVSSGNAEVQLIQL